MSPCPAGTCSYKIQSGDSLWLIAQRFQTTPQAITAANPALNETNLRVGQAICIPREYRTGRAPAHFPSAGIGKAEQTLSNLMRLLWEQHVYWSGLFILSEALGLPGADLVANRLLRNPKDFEAALRPFYGAEKAAQFAQLLTVHLTTAAELVKAAKAGDSAAAADAEKRWYANADEIAAFLGGINPYWSAREWRSLLHDHLDMLKTLTADILARNAAGSIGVFESIEKEALEMADVMTQGIVKQFPRHFK